MLDKVWDRNFSGLIQLVFIIRIRNDMSWYMNKRQSLKHPIFVTVDCWGGGDMAKINTVGNFPLSLSSSSSDRLDLHFPSSLRERERERYAKSFDLRDQLTSNPNMPYIHSYGSIASFSVPSSPAFTRRSRCASKPKFLCAVGGSLAEPQVASVAEPLLLNAVRGDDVERPPVWLMRQAGRYMKSYQTLCEKYPSFRERSENVDLIVEISLQPWKVFKPDGVILFSDILTPLSGMNIPFDIVKGKGPVIFDPLHTADDVDQVREFVPQDSVPYVGEALTILGKEVDNKAAVLGFVGAPFTLASYVVEGGSSKHFSKIKRLAFSQPKVLHALLQKFTTSMTKYIRYQADSGAQAVQIFDSWATELSPVDFEEFSLPYLKQIVDGVKETHPDLPLILYASGSGGLLERLALTGVDVVSLDWTVDMAEGRRRLGPNVAVQGNVDPGVLFGSKEFITSRINDTVRKAGRGRHILNLGHGIVVGTPEENVAHFFEVAKGIRY